MSCHSGLDIVNDGLVFAYDMGNTQKSWKGRPTTNLYINGHFAGGQHVVQASNGAYSNPVNTVVLMDNPGSSPYCLSSTAVGGSPYTEYEMIATGLQPNTTYCMSCWFAKSADWNGTDAVFHSRWWNSDGTEQGTTGAVLGTIVDTKIVNGLTWYKVYQTFTTGATTNGSHSWYAGYPSQNTTGYRYFTDFQLEVGSFPSAFANGTRSNTQAIVDLVGNNTITVSNLTYNSAGTFSFSGSNNYASISNFTNKPTTAITCASWCYPTRAPSTGTVRGGTISCTSSTYLGIIDSTDGGSTHSLHWALQTVNGRPHSWHGSIPRNAWSYIVGTYDGATSRAYINGTEVWSGSASGALTDGTYYLGTYGPAAGDGVHDWMGDISVSQIYNRALSAAEVQQNFQALRGRFGI